MDDVFAQIDEHLAAEAQRARDNRTDFHVAAAAVEAAMTPVQRRALEAADPSPGVQRIVAGMTDRGGERVLSWWAGSAEDVRRRVETLTGTSEWRASVFVAASLYGLLAARQDVSSHVVAELARAAVRYDDGVQAARETAVARG